MMNLKELFEMQKKLDEHIVKEKGLEGQDLLPQKILALQVELGELANEWRGFKFWSNKQKPGIYNCENCSYDWPDCNRSDCPNPLLEEYVDCFHFILTIGLSMRFDEKYKEKVSHGHIKFDDTTKQFLELFNQTSFLYLQPTFATYKNVLDLFKSLGEMLGFTWEQIVQAYKEKNQVNHKRQDQGY